MKNISKSIRLSKKVFDYIDSFEGDGFNQKFENIIIFAMEHEKEYTKKIKELDYILSLRNDELSDINQKLEKARFETKKILYAIRDLENYTL